jgi:uncharacterized phage-associated protein
MLNFKMDWGKAVEAVHFLAHKHPNITRFYIAKILFFADKEHLMDWGRPICGDHYVAMKLGPVPSHIYNLVQSNSRVPSSIRAYFEKVVGPGKREDALKAKVPYRRSLLSDSDIASLESSYRRYGKLGWDDLVEAGHREPAWLDAWNNRGGAGSARMKIEKLFDDDDIPDRGALLKEIREKALYAA